MGIPEDVRTPGLRERKKARTRATLADQAARLFAEHGFAAVTMQAVARAAEVSEQTVYNYFPTKESLVFDQADAMEDALVSLVAGRPHGETVMDAYAGWLRHGTLDEAARRAINSPGGMPRLVVGDAGLHRHLLGLTTRMSSALAEALVERDGAEPVRARTVSDALLQVFVRTVEALGRADTPGDVETIAAQADRALAVLRPLTAELGADHRADHWADHWAERAAE